MTFDLALLSEPFPADAIHWRAQSMNRDGTSAMALAYIDARDVMARLDEVCGPANWSDSFAETPKGRLICTLSLRINDEWIGKADGAGDTDVEGEKGAISDALKRAAVKWGIGRYLYDMPVVWADCESYETNGKKRWRKWTPAGLSKLAAARVPAARDTGVVEPESVQIMRRQIDACETLIALQAWKRDHGKAARATDYGDALATQWNARKSEVEAMDRSAA